MSTIKKKPRRDRRKRIVLLLRWSKICLFKHRESLFICIFCEEGYLDPEDLRKHYTEHGDLHLGIVLRTISGMGMVELLKADVTDVGCKLCDSHIDKLDDLLTHLIEKHNKKIDKDDLGFIPYKLNLDKYECALCDFSYTEFKDLNKHMKVHLKFFCDLCGSGFGDAKRLKKHGRSHASGSVPCKTCHKVFRTHHAMRDHYEYAHMKLKKHVCPKCPAKFSNHFQRLKHLAEVHKVELRQYQCDYCQKTFKQKTTLTTHICSIHLNISRHPCALCDAEYYSKGCLMKHLITHSGVRNYKCTLCTKAYGRKTHLVKHMKTHTRVKKVVKYNKKYECPICQKNCNRMSRLLTHTNTHLNPLTFN